jgi:hypothetical protein
MNMKKYLLSVVVVFVWLTVFGMIYHGKILESTYIETMQFWRPEAEMMRLMPFVYVGHILFALLFCCIYTKGLEAGKPGLGQGLRYGFWVGLLLHLPMTVAHYAYVPYPAKLLVAWLIGGMIESVVAGLIVGKLYQKAA